MRRIEWRRLPGAFAKCRRLQIQKSKDGLYFCPIDFVITMGFISKRMQKTHQDMVGISTFTINQKLEMTQLRPSQKGFAHLTGAKTAEDALILNKYDRRSRIPALATEYC